ncbi:MAG: FAD-dependent oxidoreductase [Fimbriimonadaceae bacterium]|nr:FAD-dependent oxidoreductase [Fimbriimonadaceae bacterium]
MGGISAAYALARLGHKVILTDPLELMGGQLVTQAVPPDEHPWIEEFGCTKTYRQIREAVRARFRTRPGLRPEVRGDPRVNPGGGWVSRLCAEPLEWIAAGLEVWGRDVADRITVHSGVIPVSCDVWDDRIESVTFSDPRTNSEVVIRADYVLDATEFGDLLPLSGAEYRVGAESQRETDEKHAPREADAEDVQGFTWCMAVTWDPDATEPIERPARYEFWRKYRPEGWPGPLLGLDFPDVRTGQRSRLEIMDGPMSLFKYRQVVNPDLFEPGAGVKAATIVNWPQNDYFVANILDKPDEEVSDALADSCQLTLSLLYWLQTELGFVQLQPCPELTRDGQGLALAPYIRESRRIVGLEILTEKEVGAEMNPGLNKAREIPNSVGIGAYRIDLHPSPTRASVDLAALPYQIPLGCLVPVRLRNLIPACKNISVSHIANGCTRLHPVEVNIGESAGLLALFCHQHKVEPRQVWESEALTQEFQSFLTDYGVELSWPDEVYPL